MEVIVDLPSIRQAIDNVSKFVGETHIRLKENTLTIQEFATSKVAFYEAKIQDCEVVGDGNFDVFINALHFNKVLKSLGKVNKAILIYENNQLKVANPSRKKLFVMPIYQDYGEVPKVPNLTHNIRGAISSAKMADFVVSTQAAYKDFVGLQFEVKDKKFNVSSSKDGYEYDEIVDEYEHLEGEGIAKYDVGWLKSISDCLIDDNVKLSYTPDGPLEVEDNGADKISQRFILAPRIDL